MRKQMMALAMAVVLGTATTAIGTIAFARGGGGGHGGGRGHIGGLGSGGLDGGGFGRRGLAMGHGNVGGHGLAMGHGGIGRRYYAPHAYGVDSVDCGLVLDSTDSGICDPNCYPHGCYRN